MTTLIPIALSLLLQSTALLGFGLLALRLTRRRGPAVQSLVGRATLAGVALALLLAAPLAGHVRPLWRVALPTPSVPPASNSGREDRPLVTRHEEPTPPPGAATLPEREGEELTPGQYGVTRGEAAYGGDTANSAPTPRVLTSSPSRSGRVAAPGGGVGSFFPALAAAWASGTILLLLWLAACQWHLTRLRRGAVPVTSGPAAETLAALTPRPPTLLTHPSVRSPFLAGLRHPAIFLPTTYDTDFDPTALRAILAHELAHLARRDNAWTLAARLLSALLWPQPLLWVLWRRLEQIGEEACDQAVLAQHCPPRAYADCLLTLAARHPLGRRERALGAGVAPFRSSLGQRIGRILDKGTHAMSTVTPRLRLTIAALSLAAAIGVTFLVSSVPAQTLPPAPQGVHSPQRTIASPSPSDAREATSANLDARIIVAQSRLQKAVQELASFQRASTITTPAHQMKQVQLSRNYELTKKILQSLIGARASVAASTKANTPPTAPDPLSKARFLAGLTPVQGPGVVVTLNDSKKRLRLPKNMPPGIPTVNIIHDTDINQVVNELKAIGAEAIAVNDQRLITTSSVRCIGPTVFVNNLPMAPPFVIKAIGNPKTLAGAMNIPGGIATQLRAYDPAMFSVREAGALTLPAYSGSSEPRYAKPVASTSPEQAQATINFLDAQIKDIQLHSRAAETALFVYKAEHHPATTQSQRELADLTRNYSSVTTLWTTLIKRKQDLEIQLRLAQLI